MNLDKYIRPKNRYAPILDLQNEIKRLGGAVDLTDDLYEMLRNQNTDKNRYENINPNISNNVKWCYKLLVDKNLEIRGLFNRKVIWYLKSFLADGSYEWSISHTIPVKELIDSQIAKKKIPNEYHLVRNYDSISENQVLVKLPDMDLLITISREFNEVARLVNSSSLRGVKFPDLKPTFQNGNKMDNQLGRSIVKAAWIIGVAMVLSMCIYYFSQPAYTSPGGDWYIKQSNGKVFLAPKQFKDQLK